IEQALLVDFRIDRLGDQREGQATAMPGTGGELFQTGAQALAGTACPAQGSGQCVHFTLAGGGEDFGGQVALAAKVAIQAAGGNSDILGQRLHGQRRETARADPLQGTGKNALTLGLVAVYASVGNTVGHGLNPDSLTCSESGFRPWLKGRSGQICRRIGNQAGQGARRQIGAALPDSNAGRHSTQSCSSTRNASNLTGLAR